MPQNSMTSFMDDPLTDTLLTLHMRSGTGRKLTHAPDKVGGHVLSWPCIGSII